MPRLIPRSLRSRLLLAMLLGMVVIEIAAGFVTYRLLAQQVHDELDYTLRDKLRFYKTTVHIPKTKVTFRMGEADWDRISDPKDPDYWVFRYDDGQVIDKFPRVRDFELPPVGMGSTEPVFLDLALPNGKQGRAAGVTFAIDYHENGDPSAPVRQKMINVVAARGTEKLEASLKKLRVFFWQGAALLTVTLLALVWFIVRRNVRHVAALERQIETMPLTDAGQRFHLNKAPSELETVVSRLNALMDRVNAAIEHERQFTSNAAHELRTPIAGMKMKLEAALAKERSPEEYAETLVDLKSIQNKLQQLTDNLLLLARLDSGQREFAGEVKQLAEFVKKAWKPFFDRSADKMQRVTFKFEEPAHPSHLPTTLLDIVLRNLFQNAVDYSPTRGTIQIFGRIANERCQIRIANTNPGITTADLQNLFQPFWRADKSGDPNLTRTGIGLALCKQVAGTLEGSIEARVEDGMVIMELEFPVGPPVPQPEPATKPATEPVTEPV